MTRAEFFKRDGLLSGFLIREHTGAGQAGEDIVCAAVSSAAYLTANTVTEVISADACAGVDEENAVLRLTIEPHAREACRAVMEGFLLHMRSLEAQYPQNIQVICTEV